MRLPQGSLIRNVREANSSREGLKFGRHRPIVEVHWDLADASPPAAAMFGAPGAPASANAGGGH